jgi:hypothetical protein
MGTGSAFKSDLPRLFGYIENSASEYVLTTLVHALRKHFARDSYYRYIADPWGFPKTPSQKDLAYDAGISDSTTTRLFISQTYRQDVIFYPAILVKFTNLKSVPISFNRNKYFINWENVTYQNSDGDSRIIQRPANYQLNGAYNISVSIQIQTKSEQSRQDLLDIISLFFIDTQFEDLVNSGITVLDVSAGGFNESDDYNGKLFNGSVDLQLRTEWQKEIRISTIIDTINFCIEFGDTLKTPFTPAEALTIRTSTDLLDKLNEL